MELQFKDLDSSALKTLAPLFTFRENKTCDSVFSVSYTHLTLPTT